MKEFELKYGCNPNQKPAKIFMHDGSELPIEILCGRPGYINFLDAFTRKLWDALDPDNKISLYIRYVDTASGAAENRLINKNK